MTKDLEQTLATLGPGYDEVVRRLTRAAEVGPRAAVRPWGRVRRPVLLAASLAVLAGGVAVLALRTPEVGCPSCGPREYVLAETRTPEAIAELVRTQRADGGWANDFLTRRNAQALRSSTDAAARLAYRKAMRNLRVRGVSQIPQ